MSTVRPNGQVTKDPSDKTVYRFDFDDRLATGVEIASKSFAIEMVDGSASDGSLTVDNDALVTGNRKVNVRVLGGTLGAEYRVTCHIVTNESPVQEFDRSVRVAIIQK